MKRKRILIGEQWGGDYKLIEYFVIERINGWEIEKRITQPFLRKFYGSLEEAMDVVKSMSKGKATIFELMGVAYGTDDEIHIYAVPVSKGMWGVMLEKNDTRIGLTDVYENTDAIKDWMREEYKYPKWNLIIANERGMK